MIVFLLFIVLEVAGHQNKTDSDLKSVIELTPLCSLLTMQV